MEIFKFNMESEAIYNFLLSAGVLFFNYMIATGLIKLINKKVKDAKIRHKSRTWIYYIFIGLSVVIIFLIWFKKDISISTFLGFLSAGIALALHQVLLNIAGWLVIIFQKPFNLGDRIEFSNTRGDVIDINMFFTTLLEVGNWVDGNQSTGRVVHIPNGEVFKSQQFNYTTGFNGMWNESKFIVSLTSDWEKAESIIIETAKQEKEHDLEDRVQTEMEKMGKSYMIKLGKLTPITYIDIEEYGISITLRYMTSVRKQREIKNKIIRKVLTNFLSDPKIEIAYPTQTIFKKDIN
ncbi:MAG: mechanosensitive ion channel family protein [Fusobacteriota bacterium]